MTYSQLLDNLNRRGQFRIKPGLDRIRTILATFGNPQDHIACIHIAGTNGKGSVAASLESVLRHAGYRTGLYTSPHLSDICERIQILNLPISERVFQATAEQILAAERQTRCTLTYFEFLTAMAFQIFAESKVNVAIIEAGMGGRWDATNILMSPVLTCITSIGLDHTQWLGQTEAAIAREKAGIIKMGIPLVSGVQGKARKPILDAAKTRKAQVYQLGKDFSAKEYMTQWQLGYQRIHYTGLKGDLRSVPFHLLGRYQVDNAALVLAGLDVLREKSWMVPSHAVEHGLAQVIWPGRFQRVPGRAFVRGASSDVLFDGAHNRPAMRQLLAALKDSPWKKYPKTFVFGVYQDKDYQGLLREIVPHAKQLIFCTAPGPRGLPAHQLPALCKGRNVQTQVVSDPQHALKTAIQAGGKNDLVVVTGSLSLVGTLLGNKRIPALMGTTRRDLAHV